MQEVPENPKIYHITHMSNLSQIIESGFIWSDAKRIELDLDCEIIGMSSIKLRRLQELQVDCFPGTLFGEYVLFYFCPSSIMLYILYMGNLPNLTYKDGQNPIVDLEADLRKTVSWADSQRRNWAFSNCNAGAWYANFWNSLEDLNRINWTAVKAIDFREPVI